MPLSAKNEQPLLVKQNEILQLIATALPLNDVLDYLAFGAEDLIKDMKCTILSLDRDSNKMYCVSAPNIPKGYVQDLDGFTVGPHVRSCGAAAYFNKTVVSEDINTDPLWADYKHIALKYGIQACWSAPIRDRKGKVLGTFAFFYEHPRKAKADEQKIHQSITHLAGIALEHDLLDKSLRLKGDMLNEAQAMAHIGSWDLNVKTGFLYWSDEHYRMFGIEKGSTVNIGMIIPKIHPNDRDRVRDDVDTALAEKKGYEHEFRFFGVNNEIRIGYAVAKVKLDEKGEVANLYGICQDITEKKRSVQEIERLHRQLELENAYLRDEVKSELAFGEIIGNSPAIKKTLQKIDMVAVTDVTVLIQGETGTGKELIARAIHERSHRNQHPLIKVNCPSIPKELFESEFFGHVRGSFTGATKERLGRFQLAEGGTLFLDEVSEIPLELQGKLLRVLQEGQFESVGGDKTMQVNVRIIAATNRNLQEEVRRGNFREDLFFRLNVFPIEVEPLRDRIVDIKPLAEHFMKLACAKYNCHCKKEKIEEKEYQELIKYSWPGNVRELKNIIERAIIIFRGKKSSLENLHFDLRGSPSESRQNFDTSTNPKVLPEQVEVMDIKQLERKQILDALTTSNWKIYGDRGAAKMLDLKPTTLAYRIKKLKIEKPH